MSNLLRRQFLQTTSAGMLGLMSAPTLFADNKSPNEKVIVGVMGTSRNASGSDGRGTHLAKSFANLPNCEVKTVCDVNSHNVGNAQEGVATKQNRKPEAIADYRRMLDDPEIDAIVIATPDHWHAPAGIAACQAGKHVYVEKPCSHNPHEGELFIEAARKYDRRVQMGTQRRSRPGLQEAVAKLHEGVIGKVLYASCCYYNARGGIGHGKQVAVPDYLNWDLWQGPAPHVAYRDNIAPYNWHWFWDWGTAEMGNNGVHYLDVLRWGLGVDHPQEVSSTGGKFRNEDDQETPDTSISTYHFGDRFITMEQRSWIKTTKFDPATPMRFFGEGGSLEIVSDSGYRAYDPNGKELASGSGPGGETNHLQNFVDSIRGEAELNCEIEEAHKSTQLCHLANISYRVGRRIALDEQTHQIKNDPAAMKLWSREYEKEFEPQV
ncbi:MAG TPA: dehydrogenase [Planctomycetaceae bacterium]|nr:dehydrogenase [Planctomycetaceae bacterium]